MLGDIRRTNERIVVGGDGQGPRHQGPCQPPEELKGHFKGQAKPVEMGHGLM